MRVDLRNKIVIAAASCAGALSLVLITPASANVVTGNPSTDGGWTSEGLSSSATNYVDGAGAYNATVYSTAFQLSASSPLYSYSTSGGYGWNVGDTIVGVGGVFTGANGDLTYSGGADQNGVTHAGSTSTRIVVKYGTSSAAWAPNNTATADPGYGSLAHGGVGSVLLGTFPYDFYPADNGTLIVPSDSPEEQTSVSGTTNLTNGDVGGVITDWNGSTLVGFESFLDLTLLDSEYPSNGVALGNKFDLDLQRGSGNFQDSIGTLPASVPEPASLGLICFAGVGILARRRRQA